MRACAAMCGFHGCPRTGCPGACVTIRWLHSPRGTIPPGFCAHSTIFSPQPNRSMTAWSYPLTRSFRARFCSATPTRIISPWLCPSAGKPRPCLQRLSTKMIIPAQLCSRLPYASQRKTWPRPVLHLCRNKNPLSAQTWRRQSACAALTRRLDYGKLPIYIRMG